MLSILTVNYNGADKTINLLDSLKKQRDSDFRIFVLDNASEKDDFDRLKLFWPDTIRSDINLGFSGGCNLGIKKVIENGSEWVILLNNDTWVENGFIARLRPILEAEEGIVGFAINEGDHIAYGGQIRWLKPYGHHIWNQDMLNIGYLTYAIGGAMAIHKDVFKKIGLLDEKYFLYFEDQDFSIRAKKAGIKISIIKDVMIYHNVSSTTKKLGSQVLLRYHYRNALYFNLKNGPWYIKFAIWPWSWIIAVKQLIKMAMRINAEQSHAILNGVADFYINKFGKIT